ncbi:MAG: GAF domain-containing protein [Nitrospiraceae bacterium]|nr:GAF domain-containing protein [Nitrospiraceae bacterium]
MKENSKAAPEPDPGTGKSGLKNNKTETEGRSAGKKQRVLSSPSDTDLERRIRERTAELVRANEELEQEIADRRRAEEQAMKSQERLFDILESISDGFFTLDRRWRFTYVNHEAVRLWRRSLGELIGRSIWEVVPDAVGTICYEQYHRAVAEKVPASFEAFSPLLNIWVEVRAYPSKEGLSVYFHDITERKIAQENVFRLNLFYSVLSKINEAIVRIREPGELYEEVCRIAVEDGLLRMAWIGLKDPVTLEVKPVARWGDEGGYLDTIRVFAADVPEGKGPTGRAVFEGKYFICSDIEVDPLMRPWKEKALSYGFRSSAAFPLRIGQDTIGAFTIYSEKPSFFTGEEIELLLSMARDVSFAIDFIENDGRRRAVEEALRDLNEELECKVKERTAGLEEAYREMEAFSYSVSHDLRSPLRIINGFAQAVLEDYGDKLDDKGKDLLKIIGTNAIRMDMLINGLLDLSRIGRQEMNVAEIDMEKMVKSLCNDFGGALSGRKVSFAVQPLPSVNGDAVLLRQVFENLLSNAVKFTRKRQEAVIEIGGWKDGREHVYFVRDNGVGFSMQYADKLFRVFQRLHNVKEFEGTGIGLSIAHRIIHKHGGRIWAEAKANEGATFYVVLPGN